MGWQPDTQPKGKPPVEKTKGAETMQRLIDADALKNSIDEHVYLVHHGFNETEYGCTQYGIHQIIDDAPTVDVVPVKHGKWIGYAGTIGNECSVCGKWIDVLQGTAEMNYCPNCGARMDKDGR